MARPLMLILLFSILDKTRAQQPLALHPGNHHYFQYGYKPILLLTAGEHYGALINLDFDYIAYFDALKEQGMNNTRIFAGSMFEREQDIPWMKYENTLAPRPNRVVVPWARSSVSGYPGGGNKFDLGQWDERYFARLKDLVTEAGKRGIIIEFTFFGNQYKDELWANSPLYPYNNIQGIGPSGKDSFKLFQTLHDKKLLARQEAMVQKIVHELNEFDNIYYEISNEPFNEAVDTSDVNDWHNHMIHHIKQLESSLPKKHLIATNEAVVNNPDVSIANYHYVKVKNMPDFDWLLSLNKVITMDETVGSLIHSDPDDVRVEAWDFILRGGGGYNNLSWEHTPDNEPGTPAAETIRKYLFQLKSFFSEFDFVKMKPAVESISLAADSAFARVLAERGKQYAVYIHHSKIKGSDWIVGYDARVAKFSDQISINLPAGDYVVRWINPATGALLSSSRISSNGGSKSLTTPAYTTDIALAIREASKDR